MVLGRYFIVGYLDPDPCEDPTSRSQTVGSNAPMVHVVENPKGDLLFGSAQGSGKGLWHEAPGKEFVRWKSLSALHRFQVAGGWHVDFAKVPIS